MSTATAQLFQRTTTIMGRISAIRWRAPDSARCIVTCIEEGGKRTLSVLGEIEDPAIGQLYEFEGTVSRNERYRTDELRLHSYRTVMPTDTLGIERYLTDTAKWVGHATARALTQAFGQETLRVIKSEPERVAAAVSGITIERARQMSESLIANEQNELAAVEVGQLLGASVPARVVRRAIKKWGPRAAAIIRKNPFRLTELPGIGFATADALWKSLGLPLTAPRRQAAAIVHALAEAHAAEGHTCVPARVLLAEAGKLVGTIPEGLLSRLVRIGVIRPLPGDRYALPDIHESERFIAASFTPAPFTEAMRVQVSTEGLAPDQIEAARIFETSPVFILTGAPGTGKTYTVARLVSAMQRLGPLLCAPTGKAAKQMSQALASTCGLRAGTIHSVLRPSVDEETGEFSFECGPDNPLSCGAVVVDEFSMVDVRLARSLLSALRQGTRILIVGDKHQLPSVGPGSVLRDLIAAGVPSFELTQIKRNAGRIVTACHAIKDGRSPSPSERLDLAAGENWRHIEADDPDEIKAIIESLYRTKIPALGITGDLKWDVQTVAPLNERGSLSCQGLNELLQGILNPDQCEEEQSERSSLPFRVGDKVVRLKNGEVKGAAVVDADDAADEAAPRPAATGGTVRVVNGDLGTVVEIGKSEIIVDLRFPARRVHLPRRDHQLRLAYCMTCHKLQGSEAPIVVLPLHARQFGSAPIWTREWIYTAMSRAKLALITVGQLSAVQLAVARVGNVKRRTMLAELLKGRDAGP